ncbi:MAG: FkbM family methyltransferase [Verrucomicrobia bacterium]|nr:MAG: FkbM family methyltransferase [Verrucomicrobiota bacterium]
MGWSIRSNEEWVMSNLITTPKHDDLIYDVGMHKGEDTEFYLSKGFRVIAFEANPELVSLCRVRFKKFIRQGQLKIVEGAIVDMGAIDAGQKRVRFYKNDQESVWGTVRANWAQRNLRLGTKTSVIEVDVINFVEVMRENGVPHFLKIDIEGVDMVCLNALSNFQERPDYVSIESDKTSYANIKHEIDTFISLGYEHFQAIEQSAIRLYQSPPEPAREGQYVHRRFEFGSSGLFGAELNDEWKSKKEILRQYRAILLGYYLLGDDGILNDWKFRGSSQLQLLASRFCSFLTKAAIPGWYDTHARHRCVNGRKDQTRLRSCD